jgi:hypothetical protein
MRFRNRITRKLALLTLSAFITYWGGRLHFGGSSSTTVGDGYKAIEDESAVNQFDAANYY